MKLTFFFRSAESKNVSGLYKKSDFEPLGNTASYQYDAVVKIEPNPKYNLKDLLFFPGRKTRPKKYAIHYTRNPLKYCCILYFCGAFRIVILMRGIPGSGKSYLSKLIKEKEQEMGGSARILSIDDYFMLETDVDTVANSHKVNTLPHNLNDKEIYLIWFFFCVCV